jgi:sporulation protein YlmC with PRC-barrel domain
LIAALAVLGLTGYGADRRGAAAPPTSAANQESEAQKAKASLPTDRDDEPEVGPVARAASLLNLSVNDAKGTTLGTVSDVALDLNESFVGFLVIELQGSPSSAKRVALPVEAVQLQPSPTHLTIEIAAARLREAPALADQNLAKVTRPWVADSFAFFGQQPYWEKRAERIAKTSATSDKASPPRKSTASSRFASLKALKHVAIINAANKPLGHIDDFAVAVETGLIAYAAMAVDGEPEGRMYQVPLSALVVRPGEKDWILDLPLDVLQGTPSFHGTRWPEKVDRTWVEYVHVRYGRSPFDGVRSNLKSTEN